MARDGEITTHKQSVKQGGEAKMLDIEYEVVKVLDKHSIKIADPHGSTINVHKTRVEIVRGAEDIQGTTQTGKESDMTAATKDKKSKKAKKVTKKAPRKKKEIELTPFDPVAWAKEYGSVHLSKRCTFDHDKYKLEAHVAINSQTGYYYTINAYRYPNGVLSLGKKNAEANKFPLKGKKVTKTITIKKTGKQEKRVNKGTETAEQLLARYLKNDYKVVSGSLGTNTEPKKEEPKKPESPKEEPKTQEAPQEAETAPATA
jgi:hypothetical protein